MERVSYNNKNFYISKIVYGAISALAFSLALILVFALLLRFFNIDVSFVMPINQAIKILSILLGVFIGLKGNKSKGFIKGVLIGILYAMLAYFIFGILSLKFNFSLSMLIDIVACSIIGGISGIIGVNIGK